MSMPVLHLLKNKFHVIKSLIICTSDFLKVKQMHLYKKSFPLLPLVIENKEEKKKNKNTIINVDFCGHNPKS